LVGERFFQCCRYPIFVCPFEVYLTLKTIHNLFIFSLRSATITVSHGALQDDGLQLATITHMDDDVGIMPGPYLYGLHFFFV
jgi:hypothetical protein